MISIDQSKGEISIERKLNFEEMEERLQFEEAHEVSLYTFSFSLTNTEGKLDDSESETNE